MKGSEGPSRLPPYPLVEQGFAAFVSYFVNHPLYTPPPEMQTLVAFAIAGLCQLSNLWWVTHPPPI